jgi:hypothetical protein
LAGANYWRRNGVAGAGRPFSGLACLAALFLLTGCAEYWARPGATVTELAQARQGCDGRAVATYPPRVQQVMTSPGYFVPQTTSCSTQGGRTDCRTTGGYFVPPSYTLVDLNESGRRGAFRNCMFADGWVLAKDKEEAAAIVNSTSAPNVGKSIR